MFKNALHMLVVIAGSILVAAGFNLFLIPHQLLSGGVSGISMIIGYFTPLNIALVYFALNLPLLISAWFLIGRRFIILSIASVVTTTLALEWLPVKPIVSDPIIASVFGGVLAGIGTGICLRTGGSTGGFDIVGSILTRKRDFPLGSVLFALNSTVVFALGYLENWDLALSSIVSIYIAGKIVDAIHIRHIKVTAFIITAKKEAMLERLLKHPRGVTLIKAEGAYTHHEQDMLMTVTTRYELAELKKMILESDPKAFVNIVETAGVMGEFRRNNKN